MAGESRAADVNAAPRATSRAAARPLLRSERQLLLLLLDTLVLGISLYVAVEVARTRVDPFEAAWPLWAGILLALWLVSASVFEAYDLRKAARPRAGVLAASQAVIAALAVYLAIPYWTPPLLFSRLSAVVILAIALVGVALVRLGYASLLTQPMFRRRALVLGGGAAAEAATELLRTQEGDYALVETIAPEGSGFRGAAGSVATAELAAYVRGRGVDEVLIADQEGENADVLGAVVQLYESGVAVRRMSDLYEEVTGKIPVAHIRGHWLGALPMSAGGGRLYDAVRRLLDAVAAVVLLVALSPLLVTIALAVRLESRGPILYRQARLGLLGRPFAILKFRTMVHGAERGEAVWAARGDPRRTRVGRLLRRTRLDELPQLWNVLAGRMTLIGPRPERPEFVARLEQDLPFYRARLLVAPGLTGWAQVRADYASSVDDSLDKLQHDLYYVKHRSPYLDLVICLRTIGVIVRASGR